MFVDAPAARAGAAFDDGTGVRRWLAKARDIQWDYKSVAKRKGVLVRLR
jgi:hypothetical protein